MTWYQKNTWTMSGMLRKIHDVQAREAVQDAAPAGAEQRQHHARGGGQHDAHGDSTIVLTSPARNVHQ